MTDTKTNTNAINPNKVRWRCRRGVLELDVILHRFFDRHYMALPTTTQALFLELLSCEDPELLAWLVGDQLPASKSLRELVQTIRQQSVHG